MFQTSLALKSQWIKGASKHLPRPRENAAGGMTEDGHFILTGGLNSSEEPSRTVWLYDPNKKYWNTTLPRLKQERYFHACVCVHNKVYVFGGRDRYGNALKSVEMLSLNGKGSGWSSLPPMKQARAPKAVAKVGDTVYVFGSKISDSNAYNRDVHGSVESFNLKTMRWNRNKIPPMPKGNQAILGSANVNDQIYLISPSKKMTKMAMVKYITMAFDPSTSKWLNTKQLPNVTAVERRGKALNGSPVVFNVGYDDGEHDNEDVETGNREDFGREIGRMVTKDTTRVATKIGTLAGAKSGIGSPVSIKVIVTTIASVIATAVSIGGIVIATVGISKNGLTTTTSPTCSPIAVQTTTQQRPHLKKVLQQNVQQQNCPL